MSALIDEISAELPALIFAGDTLGLRERLEALEDAAEAALLADLIGSREAAALWGVDTRHARRIIAGLSAEGRARARQLSDGNWVIRRSDVLRHTPPGSGRRRDA